VGVLRSVTEEIAKEDCNCQLEKKKKKKKKKKEAIQCIL